MIKIILLILFYLVFPVVIILLCRKWTLLRKIGTIGVAYLFGIALGSSGIFPEGSDQYRVALKGKSSLPRNDLEILLRSKTIDENDVWVNRIAKVQETIPAAAVVLAFPLLLFSMNIRHWYKLAGKGFLSILLGLISGVVMVTAGFFIWKDSIPESWKLAGMFEGMYTGGTANFVALQVALQVDPSLFIIANTYDIMVGAVLVLFFITIAPKIFRLILPVSKSTVKEITVDDEEVQKKTSDPEDFRGMLDRKNLVPLLKSLGLSLVIVLIAAGVSLILPMPQMPAIILTITVLGILASLIKSVNRIEKTFQLGMYLILVFSLVAASMADFDKISRIGMSSLIMFISWCYFGSLLLHLLLAKLFRVDADNFLITSTALIFSAPFVPLVAKSLDNKDVIVTGITGAILGLMLGNLIGLPLAFFLQRF